MPEVFVHALVGRTLEQKKALCVDICEAVARNFNLPVDGVTVTIVEAAKEHKCRGGVMFSER